MARGVGVCWLTLHSVLHAAEHSSSQAGARARSSRWAAVRTRQGLEEDLHVCPARRSDPLRSKDTAMPVSLR